MKAKRITVLLLTLLLAALLAWSLIAQVGDARTRWLLLAGAIFGSFYSFYGSIPDWAANLTGINADDDPENLSPRIYLTIILVVLIVAGAALAIGFATL